MFDVTLLMLYVMAIGMFELKVICYIADFMQAFQYCVFMPLAMGTKALHWQHSYLEL